MTMGGGMQNMNATFQGFGMTASQSNFLPMQHQEPEMEMNFDKIMLSIKNKVAGQGIQFFQ